MRFIVTLSVVLFVSLVYAQGELSSHPQWVEDEVFYQIFPERFNTGDPANDPNLDNLTGSYPHDKTNAWHVNARTSDWQHASGHESQVTALHEFLKQTYNTEIQINIYKYPGLSG